MIIRERLAEKFTVLPNELLNDNALSLDAITVMARLLSLPTDWTVCLQSLRRLWGCGLERLKRIMRELIAAGWVQRQPSRKRTDGSYSGGDYRIFNVRQPVQADLPLDAAEGADAVDDRSPATRPRAIESVEPESGGPESVGRTPYKGRISPRTDSPKPNPLREIPLAPGGPPAPADAVTAPKGAPSPRAVLCPDDFEPEGRHYAAAEAAGFDRRFVRETAAAMRRWSLANAHRPIARKTDWPLAFDGILDTALREATERAARAARASAAAPRRRSSHGGLSLTAELMGMPHDPRAILDTLDLGLSPARAAAPTHGAGRPPHAHLLEQA